MEQLEEDNSRISIEILSRLGAIKETPTKVQLMLKCLNPEHDDHHASMSVNTMKGVCNCFACGYSKKLTSVYYEYTGHSIYRDLGLKRPIAMTKQFYVPETSFDDLPQTDFTFEGSLNNISNDEYAIGWALKRGFSERFCATNGIMFSSQFRTYQTSDPKNQEEMSFFKNCVVIPIFEKGKLISFEARDVLGKEAWKQNLLSKGLEVDEKKYRKVLYPKHSSINTLFQWEKLDKTKPLYVTEGLMDMFSLRTNQEFKNSSCMFHCNPTERQIYLLNKFPKIIYIVDNDAPGLTACKKMMDKLPGKVYYLRPPERENIKDINDILQGKDKVIKTVDDLIRMNWLKKISNDKDALDVMIAEKTKKLN